MPLVVAVEDVWTSLCYPRCPGGHGARPASAAPRRTGAGGLCRAFAPARVLSGRLRMLAGWKGPVVRENSPDRCHGAVPEAQAARRLRMVWATAGIGVRMAANRG